MKRKNQTTEKSARRAVVVSILFIAIITTLSSCEEGAGFNDFEDLSPDVTESDEKIKHGSEDDLRGAEVNAILFSVVNQAEELLWFETRTSCGWVSDKNIITYVEINGVPTLKVSYVETGEIIHIAKDEIIDLSYGFCVNQFDMLKDMIDQIGGVKKGEIFEYLDEYFKVS